MSNLLTSKPVFDPAVFGTPETLATRAARGHRLLDLRELGLIPAVGGADRGYSGEGDVVTQTADGRDLNALWTEYQETIALQNAERQALIDFLTFPVTQLIEDVPQASGADFEVATEFGVPQSVRTPINYFSMAYGFEWYDIATRFTWKFLAEATSQQVDAVHSSVLEADNRKIFLETMRALFNNVNGTTDIRKQNYTVFRLYNGDGTAPPTYKGQTFDGTHSHYLVSGASTIDSGDLEDLINTIGEHGYGPETGSRFVVMVNRAEGQQIRKFRALQANNNGAVATYDFVPAAGGAPFLLPGQGLVGNQPAAQLDGLTVIGQYGPALIVEESYVPAGYVLTFATGGRANLQNPVGIREHVNPGLRGLRLVKGDNPNYPLTNSYYSRGFGTGIRQRGSAAILKVGTGSYTVPPVFA